MGRPDFKHRDASYQALCAQILRETTDLHTLAAAATRALSHPDVCQDPLLAGMVRSFIAEQEAALRVKVAVERVAPEDPSQLRNPFPLSAEFPTRPQLQATFARYQHDFEVHLAEYNEAAARYVLEKLEDLAHRYPVHIDQTAAQRARAQFSDLLQRCTLFRQQIEQVAHEAAAAARRGEEAAAAWLIRRLRAIHALTPALLSAERFEALRAEIERSGQAHEHEAALRGLKAREREVAAEIKRVGAAIYRFDRIARTQPPTSDEHRRAEAAYRTAVTQVRQRDTEWLTGLLLELETYLEDLDDPEGRAQQQLDRFIGTVRTALNQLRLEIRAIQAHRAGAAAPAAPPAPPQPTAPPSTDGAAATPPG